MTPEAQAKIIALTNKWDGSMTSPAYQALAKQAAAVRSDPNSWKTAPPPSSTSSNNNPGPRVEISRQFMESVSRAYPHVPLQILLVEMVKTATINPDGTVFMSARDWSNALNSAIHKSADLPKPNSHNNQGLLMSQPQFQQMTREIAELNRAQDIEWANTYGKNSNLANAILFSQMSAIEKRRLPDWLYERLDSIHEAELRSARASTNVMYGIGPSATAFADALSDVVTFGLYGTLLSIFDPVGYGQSVLLQNNHPGATLVGQAAGIGLVYGGNIPKTGTGTTGAASTTAGSAANTSAGRVVQNTGSTTANKLTTTVSNVSTGNKLTTNQNQLNHMFRNSPGHFSQNTAANRALIQNTAGNSKNFVGVDKHGNSWYAQTLPNGTQVWAEVRNGIITEGGLNNIPKPFNSQTGFKTP